MSLDEFDGAEVLDAAGAELDGAEFGGSEFDADFENPEPTKKAVALTTRLWPMLQPQCFAHSLLSAVLVLNVGEFQIFSRNYRIACLGMSFPDPHVLLIQAAGFVLF